MTIIRTMSNDPRRGQPFDLDIGRELHILRRLLLAILSFAVVGTSTDLLLLDHYQDAWQLIPLGLLGMAFLVIGWHLAVGGAASVRVFQALMLLFILGGLTGAVLHFRASAEFQAEMNPSPRRWQLAWAVLRSKVPPVLAPAVMLQMGLIGLAYTYHHPALRRGTAGGGHGEKQ
jgi:hypothetical protein